MKYLYIVRGPFGSGKTEFAKTITENVVSCWDYYSQYGQNKWNEELKPHADEYCRSSVSEFMEQGANTIAVTNSFSKSSDLDFYIEAAKQHQYKVFTLVMENQNSEEYKRDAPEDVVLKQIINLKNSVVFHQGF
ncbi:MULTISPECIES: hypothetical protein [unclassified Agarivorans]|uniref:hypothetical protein n=1 Tax=unclassified Agarivorans TaxID=2636026 RepID=UPI0026E341DC|nr:MULTISPECIES: hypothetical protein [unclassified Agarivorans]MDO6683845.1 hypothetical protein [Agarivorans sp. 3_MG-2023]MDO6714422.1 hypothetical protein [Agarivorans sp. 2_MG-2023]MDO6762341.1 hypothetical protein [Agarivorans sp. 1_MG-2023]